MTFVPPSFLRPPGRVVLVTGASSGIGRATVARFAHVEPETTRFVLVARRGEELRTTARLAGLDEARFEAVELDFTDADAPRRLADHVRHVHGRLDVLVNNAGIGSDVAFEHADAPASTDRMLDVNVRMPIQLVHEFLDLLTDSTGSIVNVGSVAGLVGQPHSPVYAATKWAITGFSDSIRARVATRGIHVACVFPGPVPTPGWPHARLTSRWWARPLYCSDDVIARAIVAAAQRRLTSPIRPRVFAIIPVFRALAPRLARRALVASAGMRASLTSEDGDR